MTLSLIDFQSEECVNGRELPEAWSTKLLSGLGLSLSSVSSIYPDCQGSHITRSGELCLVYKLNKVMVAHHPCLVKVKSEE